MGAVEQLHQSLDSGATPEAVCALILAMPDVGLLPAQRRVLQRAAGSPTARTEAAGAGTFRPVPAIHKVRVLLDLLGKDVSTEAWAQMAADPWLLVGQLRMIAPYVGWDPAKDFAGRLNRGQRITAGVDLSRRRYNRTVRHLHRTQDRAVRMQRQILLRQLVTVARSGLAFTVTVEEMRADPAAACFVAYWVARCRHQPGGDRPLDTIAEMLLTQCTRRPGTGWWMIARAYPHPGAVDHLDDYRRGELMGHWSGFMRLAAEILRDLYTAWPTRDIPPVLPDRLWAGRPDLMPPPETRGARVEQVVDRETMLACDGIDSSSWNTVVQAYNTVRDGWIAAIAAAGALDLLDTVCPGKAVRLQTPRSAALNLIRGDGLNPQNRVWAALPLPWDVLDGTAQIGRATVDWACRMAGVDPETDGGTSPAGPAGRKPTAELLHGIEAGDPMWASMLRHAGAFYTQPTDVDLGAYSGGRAAR